MRKRLLIEAEMKEPEPRYWQLGRFTIVTTMAPYGRPEGRPYPAAIQLLFRGGDDRTYTGYDLTWVETEALHARLGEALEDRRKFKVAIRKATERENGRNWPVIEKTDPIGSSVVR